MEKLKNIDEVRDFIEKNQLAFLYVSSWECSVCRDLLPKIEGVLSIYPLIASRHVEINEIPEIAGELSIFAIPVLLLFIDGKETIREGRYVIISELQEKISRYVSILQ